MMKGVVDGLAPRVVVADSLYDFDRNLFGIDQMAEEEIKTHAVTVAEKVVDELLGSSSQQSILEDRTC